MIRYKIKITSSEQAQKLNRIAEKYPYDIWVQGKSGQADAKSMLGMVLLTIENDVTLIVNKGTDTRALEKDIAEFMVSDPNGETQ